MTASAPDDYFSLLYSHFAIDSFPGLIKTLLFYLLIAACTIQTFYPVFMIIAMVIRQLGIFAHFFHKVSSLFVRRFSATFLVDCVRHTLGNYFKLFSRPELAEFLRKSTIYESFFSF